MSNVMQSAMSKATDVWTVAFYKDKNFDQCMEMFRKTTFDKLDVARLLNHVRADIKEKLEVQCRLEGLV